MAGFSVAALTAKSGKNEKKLSKEQKEILKKYKVASPYEEKDANTKKKVKQSSENSTTKEKAEIESNNESKKGESSSKLPNTFADAVQKPVSSLDSKKENNETVKSNNQFDHVVSEENDKSEEKISTLAEISQETENTIDSKAANNSDKLPDNAINQPGNDNLSINIEETAHNDKNNRASENNSAFSTINAELEQAQMNDQNSKAEEKSVYSFPEDLSIVKNLSKFYQDQDESKNSETTIPSSKPDPNEPEVQFISEKLVQHEKVEDKTVADFSSVSSTPVEGTNSFSVNDSHSEEIITDLTEDVATTIPESSIDAESKAEIEENVEEDVEEESDSEDDGYAYGEASPDQFVYYHRKDIRLKLHSGEKRRQLLDSIRTSGIHEPILVRQAANGKFEIIAGHNRQDIARELGIKVPYFLIPNVNDESADQICVDTNLLNRQHNEMLPSELSNMLAVKRKMFTLEKLSDEFHIANTTMKSFLKLQDLLPELLYEWVDTKKIGMTAGYAIACADREHQHALLDYLNQNGIKAISVKQGKEITNRGKLPWDKEFLDHVFGKASTPQTQKAQTKVSISYKELGKYLDIDELDDPKRALYNILSLKKKAESILASNNLEYSEDIIIDALESYLYHNRRN